MDQNAYELLKMAIEAAERISESWAWAWLARSVVTDATVFLFLSGTMLGLFMVARRFLQSEDNWGPPK